MIEEVAAIMKIKPRTVRAWIDRGKLKLFKPGDLGRIHEDDLEALMDTAHKTK